MATLSVEERLAKLEGTIEHLATKADIAELKGQMKVLFLAVVVVNSAVTVVMKFVP